MSDTPVAGTAGTVLADGMLISRARLNLQTNDATHVQTDPNDNRFIVFNPATGSQYGSVGSVTASDTAFPALMMVKEF